MNTGLSSLQHNLLAELEKSFGKIEPACRSLGITSDMHCEWFENDAEYRTEYRRVKRRVVNAFNTKTSLMLCNAVRTGDREMKYHVLRLWGESTLKRIIDGEDLVLDVI